MCCGLTRCAGVVVTGTAAAAAAAAAPAAATGGMQTWKYAVPRKGAYGLSHMCLCV